MGWRSLREAKTFPCAWRPLSGDVSTARLLAPVWEAYRHAIAQELHARGDDQIAGMQPTGDPHAILGAVPPTVTLVLRTVSVTGSTTNTTGLPSFSVKAATGTTVPEASSSICSATDRGHSKSDMVEGTSLTETRIA